MENSNCSHKNVKQEGGELVCQDCGLILEEKLASDYFESFGDYYSDSQRDYERRIRVSDSKALQDPIIREKYERIKTLEKWFRGELVGFYPGDILRALCGTINRVELELEYPFVYNDLNGMPAVLYL